MKFSKILAIAAVGSLTFMSPVMATDSPPLEDPPETSTCRSAGGNDRCDNGWGNGDQDAPGGSEPNNGAENKGGNRDGVDHNPPGNSWPD